MKDSEYPKFNLKMLTLKDQGDLCYTISSSNKPRLTVEPGETAGIETEDAFSGQIRKEGDRRDFSKVPYANPQSGPIYVNNATPADTLSVQIENIQPLIGQGATRVISFWYAAKYDTALIQRLLGSTDVPERPIICHISDGKVHFKDFVLPYKPMIGTMGTADPVESYLAWFPGQHGGNMDIAELTIGSTLYLPVRVDGALLHIGDVHAVQGQGELCGAAIEMPSLTTLKLDLVRGRRISWPRLVTRDAIYTIACTQAGRTLEDAIRLAFMELVLWLEEDYSFERWSAFQLLTMVAKIQIGNFWTVAVGIPKEYLGKSEKYERLSRC